jgi:hypothetical protein
VADVERVAPGSGSVDPATLVEHVTEGAIGLEPFGTAILDMVADLSRTLRRHPALRDAPAIAALAYWIRAASVTQLRDHWDRLHTSDDVVLVPRGVAFHVPPTNVDTLFVYSWLLSALVGNANIIRLSPTAAAAGGMLLDTIAEVLERHPHVAASTAIVTYDRDDATTRALSQVDVRAIWGGDDSVRTIRAIEAAPRCIDLPFPNRFSFAVIDAAAVLRASEPELDSLVDRFINDAYWFDQLACSSPRLVIWHGDDGDAARASGRFFSTMRARLDTARWGVSPATMMRKLVFTADAAAEGILEHVDCTGGHTTIARLHNLADLRRDGPGGGLFLEAHVPTMERILDALRTSDQTLTHYGLTGEQLRMLANSGRLRGIDRMVPIGQALRFSHLWDGTDLLRAFSRCVEICA